MTAEEYFSISTPTNKDFKKWTKSFLARADRAIKDAEKYLSVTTKGGQYGHSRET